MKPDKNSIPLDSPVLSAYNHNSNSMDLIPLFVSYVPISVVLGNIPFEWDKLVTPRNVTMHLGKS